MADFYNIRSMPGRPVVLFLGNKPIAEFLWMKTDTGPDRRAEHAAAIVRLLAKGQQLEVLELAQRVAEDESLRRAITRLNTQLEVRGPATGGANAETQQPPVDTEKK